MQHKLQHGKTHNSMMLLNCRAAKQAEQTKSALSERSQALICDDKLPGKAAYAAFVSTDQPTVERASRHSSRPVTALLSGHRELADLISKSSSRYAEHLQAPSIEPSADMLQGQPCCHSMVLAQSPQQCCRCCHACRRQQLSFHACVNPVNV